MREALPAIEIASVMPAPRHFALERGFEKIAALIV
jgi:hypothetical protein